MDKNSDLVSTESRKNYSMSYSEFFHSVLKKRSAVQGISMSKLIESYLLPIFEREELAEKKALEGVAVQNKVPKNAIVLDKEMFDCVAKAPGFASAKAAAEHFIKQGVIAHNRSAGDSRPMTAEEQEMFT